MIPPDTTPFSPTYDGVRSGQMALARRPALARAVRADVLTPAGGPVFIWGEPRIGKTTLVREVLWSLEPDRFLVLRMPVGALAENRSGTNRYAAILADQIGAQLGEERAGPLLMASWLTFVEALVVCRNLAENSHRALVVAVAGIERYANGLWPQGVRENLSHLIKQSDTVPLIMTSRLPTWQLNSIGLPDDLRAHFVPPLDEHESRRLLTEPVRDRFGYGDESLEHLLGAAGGRPLLLQIIGRNCDRLTTSGGSNCVSAADADEVLRACWPAGEHIFRPLVAGLEPAAQRALAGLALATEPGSAAATAKEIWPLAVGVGFEGPLEDLLVSLERLRVWRVIEDGPGGTFFITSRWLADYLRVGYIGTA